jgi:hypothetical protein
MPLVLALEWAEAHPDTTAARPPKQLLNEFIQHLGMKSPTERPAPPATAGLEEHAE